MNLTITLPEGSTNHGNPNLLCTPPKWYDYAAFFFTNYFAHAITVVSVPGQSTSETLLAITGALLLPTSGVVRATAAILRHSGTVRNDPLRRAARAGALAMVVRDWRSQRTEEDAQGAELEPEVSLLYLLTL
jgi:hypothetical protein